MKAAGEECDADGNRLSAKQIEANECQKDW